MTINRISLQPVVILLISVVSAKAQAPTADTSLPYVWKSVAINGGGFVTGIVSHPGVKGLMYARTDVGGAYRSDDAGAHWIAITDWISKADNNLYGIESIAIDPADPDRLYLMAGTYMQKWATNGAILRSTDRGRTFQRTDMPFKMGGNEVGRLCGERLAVDPNRGEIVFCGSRSRGLWKSADCGETWGRVKSFPDIATAPSATSGGEWKSAQGIDFVLFDPTSASAGSVTQTLYAGVCTRETSLYRSTDAGGTWTAIEGQPVGQRPNHIARASNGTLYISYGDEPGPGTMSRGAVWKFEPGPGKWTDVSPKTPDEHDGFGYGGVSVDAQNHDTLVVSTFCRWAHGDSIFRSTDAGLTWSEQTVGGNRRDEKLLDASSAPYAGTLSPHWIGDVEIDPFDSNHFLFTTGFGIWTTHNAGDAGGTEPVRWTFANNGLEEVVPNVVVSPPTGAHLLSAIGDFDGFRHDDLDTPPQAGRFSPPIGSTGSLDFAEKNPDLIVRVGYKAFSSVDGGVTWQELAGKPPGTVKCGGQLAVSADGRTFVWTPGDAPPAYSRDMGATWQACTGISEKARPVADREDPAKFYALDREDGTACVSTDGGATFTAAASDLPKDGGMLRPVPGHAGDVWLVSGGKLLRSTDSAASFKKFADIQDATKVGFGKAATDQGYPAVYLVGTANQVAGIFRSDDAGESWTRVNDDRHQYGWINSITGDPRVYGRVYIGTGGRGILYGDLR